MNENKKEKVQLDEIMKLLFSVSKPMLVAMLNSLFDADYAPDTVEIKKTSTEFVDGNLNIISGDLFLEVRKHTAIHSYHLEFQTLSNNRMAIRLLQYDLAKATENQQLSGGEMTLYMPKSMVIHIEESAGIPDEYGVTIVFADGESKRYYVPVLKYWQYGDDELIAKKLYPLLPLQVFMLRSKLDRITKNGSKESKLTAILQAKSAAERVAKEAESLYRAGMLNSGDFDIILTSVEYLFKHLNDRYEIEEKLGEEVHEMIKTIYQTGKEEGLKEGLLETAKKMVTLGIKFDIIEKVTGIGEEELRKTTEIPENEK